MAPSLILIGELDEFMQGCREMVNGRSSDPGISRTVGEGFPSDLLFTPVRIRRSMFQDLRYP